MVEHTNFRRSSRFTVGVFQGFSVGIRKLVKLMTCFNVAVSVLCWYVETANLKSNKTIGLSPKATNLLKMQTKMSCITSKITNGFCSTL